ncbi:similar to Saccharomyces cerevisiae YDR364C CDC40 Pre-mRNA splicing factor, important for catalytic step II of pre-mRNA splicing and plays a role in cell cycle progression [Maudiozyma barnettii]|uniref:Pre-mRNA-processing factor 17 n=1 Tax=Maudiozyma barnettii TaxID=61262 RepID=A0A8H2VDV7_9SACH|nr:Cdc40p [Kazachstania barnettii]CAB4253759.1 similar to Saccharomyces cerevisiae YDR364C CDC40 Pre-mRNA splicing factor, important for catalytic step II of pre-mRNA splicing and plays a role in cell cycle progression [Kazachstania barnettii]CAD1781507.1 similar to Saccharomyces cerevisiae YDR364C CDC40 Pre-mRNA splicing factor, important for catalytic step II of pre-mRNA splicing and plays a role in cell cycle progression [Kazachstania barnettii]
MGIIEGYSSSSDSENTNESLFLNNVQGTDGTPLTSKKRHHFTKRELKKRKQARKTNSPWGSWSSEDEGKYQPDDYTNEDKVDEKFELVDDDSDTVSTDDIEISHFYGKSEKDYRGRSSILNPPVDIETTLDKKSLTFKTYLPKKVKYTFEGHKNGTTSLKFIPNTGHLFLSGGNDNKIKLWDFYHERICIRDYEGHSKSVNSMDFVNDGTSFISSSYDKTVKVWDTETGSVLKRLRFKDGVSCCEFRPTGMNEFIVGLSDSRILHYDTRVTEQNGLVQTYDHHIGGILDVKYFQDGSKFISSSEDKTVMIWNSGVNIPIKNISDTAQYSMPVINTHPTQKYFCTQSMDNAIYTYNMKPKFRKLPNKIFKGQKSVGYAIGFTFAPDGHYICSGDIRSKVLLWDWTTSKLLKEISIPGKSPISQVKWHPQETSKVICSGPAGKIYLLD